MLIAGKLHAESPIYRGNSRKTLFTRDGSGKEKLVSLSGQVEGTAQSLMDAFVGYSKNRKNSGLLNQLWQRLYNETMPEQLIRSVSCKLDPTCYNKKGFFDLRMGLKLDEDRGAAEAGKNYKLETIFRNAQFDFRLDVEQSLLVQNNNAAKLLTMLEELQAGRFWFGAGKSRGLGRCRLEMLQKLPAIQHYPSFDKNVNHLSFNLSFSSAQPILVGWNWGKVDPSMPAFNAVEGKFLIDSFKQIPQAVRTRLMTALGGPISDTERWQNEFKKTLPKAITLWLMTPESIETQWFLPETGIKKLGKGKFPISSKILAAIAPMVERPFKNRLAMDAELKTILGERDAKKYRRILDVAMTRQGQAEGISPAKVEELSELGLTDGQKAEIMANASDEAAAETILAKVVSRLYPQFEQQIDQQLSLLQSDPWVDMEIESRKSHLKIKEMLLAGQITEREWGDLKAVPQDVPASDWREFVQSHSRVPYHQMLNRRNLQKSIVNDQNVIDFLQHHRHRTHQELSKPEHIDFRYGGDNNRTISQAYGKPYDSVFMRMLCWSKTHNEDRWEVYIPGSTIKGAFRKRATQILRALWGDHADVDDYLTRLFGAERKPGLLRFSDAYPVNTDFSRKVWCSMDSITIDPRTGKPLDKAKSDYLYAYGDELKFSLDIVAQDVGEYDLDILALTSCLLRDFQQGDIPLGADKTSGLGWVEASFDAIEWLTGAKDNMTAEIFDDLPLEQKGSWHCGTLTGERLAKWNQNFGMLSPEPGRDKLVLPTTMMNEGYISHRSFGGYCGYLVFEGKVLTPLHIQESGEPTYAKDMGGKRFNGWDMFSLSSPEVALRDEAKTYAIPSKTLRGLMRALYAITCDARRAGKTLSSLNAAEKLFGWVGEGPNQALMGRVSFDFAKFTDVTTQWGHAPHHYGQWAFLNGKWELDTGAKIEPVLFANEWRFFPHATPAPCVKWTDGFSPDGDDATYFNAVKPGSTCRFGVRFWNLEKDELERLIWCVALEDGLAHKLGKSKQLGLGSVKFSLSSESYLINWSQRYGDTKADEWKVPIELADWHNPNSIQHYDALREFLDAASL